MHLLSLALFIAAVTGAPTPSVQEMLDHAVESRAAKVVLPAGRVEVRGKLRVNGAEDLIIEGRGTTLVFSDYDGTSWSFNSCRNITLLGFAVDYDPVPFVQGRITSRSDDGKRYHFTVSSGYPGLRKEDAAHHRQAYIFEPDCRRWKPWVPDLYARQVEIDDERHGRFIMGYVPTYHHLIEVGDRIVLTIRSGGAIRMNDCEDVRIEDVTFLAAPGSAYLGRYMRGDNYYRYTIKPGPPPAGATEPRLISTCADGLNIAFATKGPTIEGCKFSFMGDDSVNLHGVTFTVVQRQGPRELLVAWPYSSEYLATVIPKGATVRRLRPGNYEVLGTAKLAGFAPIKERRQEHLDIIHEVWPRNQEGRGTVFRLTLAEPFSAEPGDFLDVPASNAPGFLIRDCVFEDHRARGLRIMASHGVIERNTFRRLKMNAITVGAEYGFWREAGWVEDVTIRGNTVEDVCRDGAVHGTRAYVLGAISLFVRADPRSELPIWPGNRRIVIENNTIRDCPVAGIFVAAAENVKVRGNRLEHCLFRPGESTGRDVGLDVREAIDVRYARDVEVVDNQVAKTGEAPDE
ncbi:MAG: right-handed parallel beta-helix repeat-containing protein [Planctomycetes bacterium]|nr:right-handed parallel beta-helix repeat-containing protein [Planctomycetota bacterium]